ncbi:MAG: HEAT repeat domain-containing protein [Kofleriaceae bacterium]
MTREGTIGRSVARAVATLFVVLWALRATPARADNVDTLIKQLEDSSDKIRLSAALNLTKLGDPRAIPAMAKRAYAANESDKNVRGAAAAGLGRLVTAETKPGLRKLAVAALESAASGDPSDFVKQQAQKSLAALGAGSPEPTTPRGSGGGVYVNIGPMSSKTGTDDAVMREMMQKVATKTMGRVASNMPTTWPGGVPTKAALDQKGVQGFYVDGTLNELKVEKSGSTATVTCKISMLLASFPDRSIFGLLNGGAKVQGGASPRDIALAREDCVSAVVEDLIAKKIVPTIRTKAGAP